MKSPCQFRRAGKRIWNEYEDSSAMLEMAKHYVNKDDETASTTSDSESFQSLNGHSVTFAENVVTEVRFRPYTTLEEKYLLFYNDQDFADFRRESYSGKRHNRLVSFCDSIVSEVHSIPVTENASQMFYSEAELQKYVARPTVYCSILVFTLLTFFGTY